LNQESQSVSDGVDGIRIGGTLIWYYHICPRQVWLMGHQINPDEDHEDLQYGRFLQQHAYSRDKKEIEVGSSRIDLMRKSGNRLVVVEVKKSSRAIESARMQLAYYLLELEQNGINAVGELRFPEERRKEEVALTPDIRKILKDVITEIQKLLQSPYPPAPNKIKWCQKCAYYELCWS
jgi:CRISPR-associated exonuclease Cas4